METKVKARLTRVNLYEEKKDAGYVCRRCGISRPTLRKWYCRYKTLGVDGLKDRSKRPQHSPNQKVNEEIIQWVLQLREQRNLGARRIQTELMRLYERN